MLIADYEIVYIFGICDFSYKYRMWYRNVMKSMLSMSTIVMLRFICISWCDIYRLGVVAYLCDYVSSDLTVHEQMDMPKVW